MTSPPTRRVGSIADLDPVNNFYGSLSTDFIPPSGHGSRGEPVNHNNQHVMSTPIGNQKQQQNKAPSAGVSVLYDRKCLVMKY